MNKYLPAKFDKLHRTIKEGKRHVVRQHGTTARTAGRIHKQD
jgi:hypothetical protein